jgi:hypothetical protein
MTTTPGNRGNPDNPTSPDTVVSLEVPVISFDQLYDVSVDQAGVLSLNDGQSYNMLTRIQATEPDIPGREAFPSTAAYNRFVRQDRSARLIARSFTTPGLLGAPLANQASEMRTAIQAREDARAGASQEQLSEFENFKTELLGTMYLRANERAGLLRQAIGFVGWHLWLVGSLEINKDTKVAVQLSSVQAESTEYGAVVIPIVRGRDQVEGTLPRGVILDTLPLHVAPSTPAVRSSDQNSGNVTPVPPAPRQRRP